MSVNEPDNNKPTGTMKNNPLNYLPTLDNARKMVRQMTNRTQVASPRPGSGKGSRSGGRTAREDGYAGD